MNYSLLINFISYKNDFINKFYINFCLFNNLIKFNNYIKKKNNHSIITCYKLIFYASLSDINLDNIVSIEFFPFKDAFNYLFFYKFLFFIELIFINIFLTGSFRNFKL